MAADRVDDLADRVLAVEGEQRLQAREWREAVAAVKKDLAEAEARLKGSIGQVHDRVDTGFKEVDAHLDRQDGEITQAIRVWPSSAYLSVGALFTLVVGMIMNGWLHIFGK